VNEVLPLLYLHGLSSLDFVPALAAVPRLQELCTELASSPIPSTLVHDDLHAGNVMRTAVGRFVVSTGPTPASPTRSSTC
jgi:hypothetical protein